MRESNIRKPALRSAIELRRRLESTRTQERRARIADAANEAEQALYTVLRISPPQSSDKPNSPTLTPRKSRVGPGRMFRAWLDRQALDNVRHQLSLLVSTPSHHSHAQTRAAKQQASIWASRYATHAIILILLLGIAAMGGFKGLTVQAASVSAPPTPNSSIDTDSFGGNNINVSFNSYSALDGDAAAKADVANRVQIVTRFPDRVKGYTVQAGDTLASLATKFGVDKPTLMWANHIVDPDADLAPGSTMLVLPVKGMYHTVEAGDTVESIAATYQVEPAAITSYKPNQLQPPYALNVGDAIIVPGGSIPARDRIITYKPHPGETIGAVAQKFGLGVHTLLLANPDLGDGSTLSSDNQLIVPPIDGIVHTVAAGDTLDSIATYYGVNPRVLVDFAPNHLKAGAQLAPDTVVMVPGGLEPTPTPMPTDTPQPADTPAPNATDTPQAKAKATPKPAISSRQQPVSRSSARPTSTDSGSASISSSNARPTSTPSRSTSGVIAAAKKVNSGAGVAHGSFIWPTYGTITQGFWAWEWGRRHGGLDVANSSGTPIVAADGGTVISAGWRSDGFGYCVIIDHGNGFKTLYGHMRNQPSVWVGEAVSRGQYLGPMGSTGNSTGPHVHFAIYYNDILRDPLNYLG